MEKERAGRYTVIRLNVIAEGNTEQNFINQILRKHLAFHNVFVSVRRIETKRGGLRGGMTTYQKAKNDLLRWMKEDQHTEARFTTMFDLYALPNDFPDFDNAYKKSDPYEKITAIETSFKEDIKDYRFIPYIQLHEYEALILSEPDKFENMFPKHEHQIETLKELVKNFKSPELINDGKETAPSKRIINEIPSYKSLKKIAGVEIAEKIGLETIRTKCPHFNEWLIKLETLKQ
jgi:hypothetical protein